VKTARRPSKTRRSPKPKKPEAREQHRFEIPRGGSAVVKMKPQHRSFSIESDATKVRSITLNGQEFAIYRFAVSSETPCAGWNGMEVLVHDKKAVDLSRAKGGSIRDDHWGPQLGVSDRADIDPGDRRLYVEARFSKTQPGQDLELDVATEIKQNTSIRFIPIEGELRKRNADGTELWYWTKWMYVHTAFTPDPADFSVGPTRGMDDEEEYEVTVHDRTLTTGGRKEISRMPGRKRSAVSDRTQDRDRDPELEEDRELEDRDEDDAPARERDGGRRRVAARSRDDDDDRGAPRGGGRDRDDDDEGDRSRYRDDDDRGPRSPRARRYEVGEDRDVRREQHRKDLPWIRAISEERSVDAKTLGDWCERQLSRNEVSRELIDKMASDVLSQPPARDTGHSARQMENHSMRRSAAAAAGLIKFDGFEREWDQEARRHLSKSFVPSEGGILVPFSRSVYFDDERALDRSGKSFKDLLHGRPDSSSRRDRTLATNTASGAALVTNGPLEFVDELRNASVLGQAGATFLPGLRQPLPFARKTGHVTVTCLGEGGTITPTDMTISPFLLGPKRWGGASRISREMLLLGSVDSEALVNKDLADGFSIGVDAQAFAGVGGAFPLGLLNQAEIQTLAMGGVVPSWLKLNRMWSLTGEKNALRGACAYIMTYGLAGALASTPKTAGNAIFLWEGGSPPEAGRVAGYPAYATNQLPNTLGGGLDEHAIVFGPWQDQIVGFFGPMELLADPFTRKLNGEVEIAMNALADTINRYPDAFVFGTGAKAA
jgi:HK97 family phage major capsid protein